MKKRSRQQYPQSSYDLYLRKRIFSFLCSGGVTVLGRKGGWHLTGILHMKALWQLHDLIMNP